ncbi:MAG TPA: hypothetical protein VHU80_24340 [Polyangiaceae bacterium]|nr:hypothetical protein [Polyangiaceae bacterium]
MCDVRHGICVQCTDDTDCSDPDTPYCEGVSGGCVECLDDSDCPRDGAYCDHDHVCRS